MAKSYLDYDGLLYLWQKIKTLFATKDEVTTTTAGLMSSVDKVKLNGIATNAEVNQSAFSNVKIGNTIIEADAKTDTLELEAGNNVTLTPDTTNDKVTIAATDTTYSDFIQATQIYAGSHGLVPAPSAFGRNNQPQVLLSNGTWGSLRVERVVGPGTDTSFLIYLANQYAPKASPSFSGNPTAPTQEAGNNSTRIATTAFVTTAITNAIAGVQGIQYSVVASLPATGAVGTIYLVSNSGSGQNIYDEYIWVNNGYEKIGTTDVDLTGYLQTTDVLSITNAEIDTILAT